MRVEIENKEEELKFPMLMIHKKVRSVVVYAFKINFSNDKEFDGVQLSKGEGGTTLEGVCQNWNFNYFEPFKGKITLQNN